MVDMKKKLIAIVVGVSLGILISLTANADLDKAIAYAEAGDVKKGQMELVNIAHFNYLSEKMITPFLRITTHVSNQEIPVSNSY